MVTAIVLLNTERDAVNSVAEALAALNGVSEVYSVSGNYDLLAILRVHSNEAIADVMTEHVGKVPGITDTHTMLAFRAYSKHDLESMFGVGA
ncbi:MAG: Lrp/AsnC family transcriptional regulator [Gammaproteobacteria bacterium]